MAEADAEALLRTLVGKRVERLKADVPHALRCPITLQLLEDPVTCADNHTYEKEVVAQHLQSSNLSPMTGAALPHTRTFPNHLARAAVEAYKTSWLEEVEEVFPSLIHLGHFAEATALLKKAEELKLHNSKVAISLHMSMTKSRLVNVTNKKAMRILMQTFKVSPQAAAQVVKELPKPQLKALLQVLPKRSLLRPYVAVELVASHMSRLIEAMQEHPTRARSKRHELEYRCASAHLLDTAAMLRSVKYEDDEDESEDREAEEEGEAEDDDEAEEEGEAEDDDEAEEEGEGEAENDDEVATEGVWDSDEEDGLVDLDTSAWVAVRR